MKLTGIDGLKVDDVSVSYQIVAGVAAGAGTADSDRMLYRGAWQSICRFQRSLEEMQTRRETDSGFETGSGVEESIDEIRNSGLCAGADGNVRVTIQHDYRPIFSRLPFLPGLDPNFSMTATAAVRLL